MDVNGLEVRVGLVGYVKGNIVIKICIYSISVVLYHYQYKYVFLGIENESYSHVNVVVWK